MNTSSFRVEVSRVEKFLSFNKIVKKKQALKNKEWGIVPGLRFRFPVII